MWLLPFEDLQNEFGITLQGVLSVGAHQCQEIEVYKRAGCRYVVWIEALPRLVHEARAKHPGIVIHEGVITDKDNELVELIETNNEAISTSLLEMKTHRLHFPAVWEVARHTLQTVRLDTLLVERSQTDIARLNVLKIDVQGGELNALRSLGVLIEHFEFLYCKVFYEEVMQDVPLVEEIDQFLSNQPNACHVTFERVKTRMTLQGWGEALYRRNDNVAKSSVPVGDVAKSSVSVGVAKSSLSVGDVANEEIKKMKTVEIVYEENMQVAAVLDEILNASIVYTRAKSGLVNSPETFIRNIRQIEDNLEIWGYVQDPNQKNIWKLDHEIISHPDIWLDEKLLLNVSTVVIENALSTDLDHFLSLTAAHLFQFDLEKCAHLKDNIDIDDTAVRVNCVPMRLNENRDQGMSLDEYCGNHSLWYCDLLLLRTVGTDLLKVLRGASGFLHGVRMVQMDVSGSEWEEVIKFLQRKGFRIFAQVMKDGRLRSKGKFGTFSHSSGPMLAVRQGWLIS